MAKRLIVTDLDKPASKYVDEHGTPVYSGVKETGKPPESTQECDVIDDDEQDFIELETLVDIIEANDIVDKRDDQLTEALCNFLMVLCSGADGAVEPIDIGDVDVGMLLDIEQVVFNYGYTPYHPCVVQSDDGTSRLYYTQF